MDNTVSLPPRFTAHAPHEGLVKIVDTTTSREGTVPLYCYQSVAGLLGDLFAQEGEPLVPQAGVHTGSVKIPAPDEAANMDAQEEVAEDAPKRRKPAAKAKTAAKTTTRRGRKSKEDRAAETADLLAQDFIPADAEPEPAEDTAEEASQPEAVEAAPETVEAEAKPAKKTSARKEPAKASPKAPAKAKTSAAAPKAPAKAPAKAATKAGKTAAPAKLDEVIEDDGFKLVLKKGERAYDIVADSGVHVGIVQLAENGPRVKVIPEDEPESDHANLTAALARIDVLVHEEA